MKKIFTMLFITAFSVSGLASNAQSDTPTPSIPKTVSQKGYWVVESNKKTPKECIVYFYNNDHLMVYKEEIKDRKLKLNRKKTLLHLKAVLEEAVTKHESGSWAHQNNLLTQLLQE